MATIKDLIMKYVELRHEKTKVQDRHKVEVAPYNQALAGLEAVFMAEMDKQEVDSISARDLGTIYRSTRSTVTVADFDLLKAYVLEHDAWELLQARASAPAVEAHLEDTGELPPGINISRILKINVRKD
jgi:hypothetical protein